MPITSAVYQPRGVQTTPRLSDFKYALPDKLIAQEPLAHRDESRLLIVDRDKRQIVDGKFTDVLDYLDAGDVLVVNETRVFPARLRGYKEKTEAEIEVFLLRRLTEELWEVLVKPARKVRTGNTIMIGDSITCEVIDNTTSGGRVVRFHYDGDFAALVEKYGQPPLPPYIRREPKVEDRERYQTIFARVSGAVAAPTAGLHFSEELIKRVGKKGINIVPIILHVGLGTFRPVQVEDLSRHRMDSEYYEVNQHAVDAINGAIENGKRVTRRGHERDAHAGNRRQFQRRDQDLARLDGQVYLSALSLQGRRPAGDELPPAGIDAADAGVGVCRPGTDSEGVSPCHP